MTACDFVIWLKQKMCGLFFWSVIRFRPKLHQTSMRTSPETQKPKFQHDSLKTTILAPNPQQYLAGLFCRTITMMMIIIIGDDDNNHNDDDNDDDNDNNNSCSSRCSSSCGYSCSSRNNSYSSSSCSK